jgi:glycosyltransferase involved in cell wall biosynthesis
MPMVSVVMPVRNGERFLRQAMASVRDQTVTDWELIVVDDGSTDATPEILRAAAAGDSRVGVHRREGGGVGPALRMGCSLASAPLIARMDADDVCRPQRLERQLELLALHPRVAVVGAGVEYVDHLARPVKVAVPPVDDAGIRQRLEVETVFFHPTVVFRREAYEAVGGYRDVAVPAEDLDLWLRLAERHELANVPEPLLEYRLHADQQLVAGVGGAARAVLAVRASAASRRRGEEDPLDTVTTIDDRLVLRLGISAEELQREEVDTLLYVARKLDQAGAHATAAELRQRASRLSSGPAGGLRGVLRGIRRRADR